MRDRYSNITRRVTATVLENIDRDQLQILWYETDDGEKFIPSLDANNPTLPDDIPEGFTIQVSRFPYELKTNYLRSVVPEEVAECEHPEDYIEIDHGLIEGEEGRTCNQCGGYQSKKTGAQWPEEWEALGSRPFFSTGSSWSEDLALALVGKGLGLSESIIICAESCERCMNVLAFECGLDWGYEFGSEDCQKCGTSCHFCEGLVSS